MKYGELKIEALKLMFVNNGEDIHEDDLSIYEENETYRFYLLSMPASINRAFGRIEERRVLPSKTRDFRYKEWTASATRMRFDLSRISDFYDIERLIMESDDGEYISSAPFEREGNTIVVPFYEETDGVRYTLVYKPRIERVRSSTANDKELGIPEGLASLIPYYVKGDLFRDDEPAEASEARNWFEAALDEQAPRKEAVQKTVECVYSQTGW